MPDSRGSNTLVDYLRCLLDDQVKQVEDANGASPPFPTGEFFTPFDVAVPYLVRWINVSGISAERLREYLAGVRWCGPTERTDLVAELERLDREGYAHKLSDIIKEECPVGAARVGKHPEATADGAQTASGSPILSEMEESAVNGNADPYLTHVDLANRYHLEPEQARKRLDRWRRHNGVGWHEVRERRANQPKYLYQLSAVRSLFERQ